MGDTGSCIAKYVLCTFNFIIFLCGGAVLTIGVILAVNQNAFSGLFNVFSNEHLQQINQPTVLEQIGYIFIVAGAFLFIIGFLGCCGAVFESRILLTLYGSLIILICLLEVVAGVLGTVYKQEAEHQVRSALNFTLQKYYSGPKEPNAFTVGWNYLMMELHCCGVNNYTDFETATLWQASKQTGQVIPVTCCKLSNEKPPTPVSVSCIRDPKGDNSYYLTGCYDSVWVSLSNNLILVIAVGIGIGAIQLIAAILAFCLCNSIRPSYK